MTAAADSGPARLPMLLRSETFGGLLFRPEDAVHIELDHEAYDFVRAHLAGQRTAQSADEVRLLDSLREQIGAGWPGVVRTVSYGRDVPVLPFQVYNAPTLADFQITTLCSMGCPHCYASSAPDGQSVSLADAEHVLEQLSLNGVTQLAIGGGEPLSHPHVVQILELCHQRGIVPNLTTNGLYLDAQRLAAMRRWCGAVALSLEGVGEKYSRWRQAGFAFFEERLGLLLRHGIPTVLQVTLSQESFADLDEIVDYCLRHPALYGVIFLAYKQVGRGEGFHHVLAELEPQHVHQQLRHAFVRLCKQTRVGYDCCLTPGIVGAESDLHFTQTDQLEGCSALRSSMGILPSLDVTPCTFTTGMVTGNLRQTSLFDIWRGPQAEAFRQRILERVQNETPCSACTSKLACLGGCPVFDLVHCRHRARAHEAKQAR